MTHPNPYPQFVAQYARVIQEAKALPLGGHTPLSRPALPASAPKVLVFSPHPDDECIIGGLPLRLFKQSGMRVVNVAVTQGSNKARQQERYEELRRACEFIGFDLAQTSPTGLEKINVKGRSQDTALWGESVSIIAGILRDHQPHSIFFPHAQDWNSSHIGVHLLVTDALKTLGSDFNFFAFETEYWGQMSDPNLMAEVSAEDLGELLGALSFHVGEVRRNPFHLALPAWMQDNVRRGSEIVGGQGGAAPDYLFATLYRMRRWRNGQLESVLSKGKALSAKDSPATLFA